MGASGHIAGIINAPKKHKGSWWSATDCPPDPDAWLGSATKKDGSWWPDWFAWLAERSGPMVTAPPLGSAKHQPQEAAPGTYVLAT
ncbi:MAG: hypothetical protein JO233_08740 [Candidatus Eremiobacteraeota bacterium]|nr:hypothetical protein [Candidatus Eremiobacteraeota bacterium]